MKSKLLKKEINKLKVHYGNHSKAAIAIGIDPRYYRRIRKRGTIGRLMRLRINYILTLNAQP